MYLLMLNSCDYIHSIIMESETKRFLLIHLHHPIQFCTVQLYSIWIHLHLQSAGNIRLVWLFKLILQSCSRGRCCYCNCECRHDSSWWLCSLKNHCSTWRGLVVGTTLHLYNMVYMKASFSDHWILWFYWFRYCQDCSMWVPSASLLSRNGTRKQAMRLNLKGSVR